jgi:hypothetical protein
MLLKKDANQDMVSEKVVEIRLALVLAGLMEVKVVLDLPPLLLQISVQISFLNPTFTQGKPNLKVPLEAKEIHPKEDQVVE